MPMTTYRSTEPTLPKDEELCELLKEVEDAMKAKFYIEEHEERYMFKVKTYYSLLHPIGKGEYQVLNIGRDKQNIMAYLYGVLYNA